jgi:hypothetical protein
MGEGIITSETQLRSHLSKAHPALSSQEITSEVQSASELVFSRFGRERCPFCLTLPASTPGQYFSHIGRHLQEVALAAIPMSLMSEDTGSLEGLDDSDDEVQREGISMESAGMTDSQTPAASKNTDENDRNLRSILSESIDRNISSVIEVVKRLREVCESDNDIVFVTAGHFTDICAILKTILTWHMTENSGQEIIPQLYEDISISLDICAILVKVIFGQLSESGCMPGLKGKQKIRYVWLEDVLKEHLLRLEDLVRTLRLLLTICRRRTLADQSKLLAIPTSRKIIEKGRAEMVEIDEQMTMPPQDLSVLQNVDSFPWKLPDDMRVEKEEHAEIYPGSLSGPGDPFATIVSIMEITHLVERLHDYGKDQYSTKSGRLAFDESVEELFAIVKRFEVRSKSVACDNDLLWRQIERSNDTDTLQAIKSAIEDALHESRPSRGFRANARRLLNRRDAKGSQITVEKVKEWTAKIRSILDNDHSIVARDHQQDSGSRPRDGERRAYAERAAKAEQEALRRANRLADSEYFEGEKKPRPRIAKKALRQFEAVDTSMRRPQQQLEESESDLSRRRRIEYEKVERLVLEERSRRRQQQEQQIQQLEDSERDRIQRERIEHKEVRRLELEERSRRRQQQEQQLQQLEESERDRIQRKHIKYEEVERLVLEERSRRRQQQEQQLQQLEESERDRIQRERIEHEEVRRLELEERRGRSQQQQENEERDRIQRERIRYGEVRRLEIEKRQRRRQQQLQQLEESEEEISQRERIRQEEMRGIEWENTARRSQ